MAKSTIKALKSKDVPEPKKEDKKKEEEELEAKVRREEEEARAKADQDAGAVNAQQQAQLPDLEDAVDAAEETQEIRPPKLEPTPDQFYQATQPDQGGDPGYLPRPGEDAPDQPFQPKAQEIGYRPGQDPSKPSEGQYQSQEIAQSEAEEILSKKLSKGYRG